MNKQNIFSFTLWSPSAIASPDTWTDENGKQYLLFYLLTEVEITNPKARQHEGEKTKVHVFFTEMKIPFLIVPDDNLPIINQIKNRKKDDIFTTSLENLQFKPDFIDEYGGKGRKPSYTDGFLIKDISKLEKVNQTISSFAEITFKVVNQRKLGHVIGTTYEESFSKYGSYDHELEIEPLNLGIEGMPPITKIVFEFFDPGPAQISLFTTLTKSKLYKSSILTESVGKIFTMRVKQLSWWKGLKNLTFSSDHDFEWDSFKEVKEQPSKNNQSSTDSQTGKDNGSTENKGLSTGAKIGIAVGLIFSVIIAILYYYYAIKKWEKR